LKNLSSPARTAASLAYSERPPGRVKLFDWHFSSFLIYHGTELRSTRSGALINKPSMCRHK
jgi:hypothetical protein